MLVVKGRGWVLALLAILLFISCIIAFSACYATHSVYITVWDKMAVAAPALPSDSDPMVGALLAAGREHVNNVVAHGQLIEGHAKLQALVALAGSAVSVVFNLIAIYLVGGMKASESS